MGLYKTKFNWVTWSPPKYCMFFQSFSHDIQHCAYFGIQNDKLNFLNVLKFNWVTGSPPKLYTLLASWYPTYMQSFIISHSSCAEQYGDIVSLTHTLTHKLATNSWCPTSRPYQYKCDVLNLESCQSVGGNRTDFLQFHGPPAVSSDLDYFSELYSNIFSFYCRHPSESV